ncbi:hypothetical protein ACB092_11G171800 [Castanea dentata]
MLSLALGRDHYSILIKAFHSSPKHASISKPTFSLVIIIIIVDISIPTVQSEYGSSTIQLPFKDVAIAVDLYANSNNRPVTRPTSCPVKCLWAAPICGIDGVTYWCGCDDALCADVKVARLGFCEVNNGGPGPFSSQALLLVHIVWLIMLGFSMLFGLF